MAFRSPPEALLRPLLRAVRAHGPVKRITAPSPRLHSTTAARSSEDDALPVAAVCNVLQQPLSLEPHPTEALSDGQVKVLVHHAAVNFADILMVQGKYQVRFVARTVSLASLTTVCTVITPAALPARLVLQPYAMREPPSSQVQPPLPFVGGSELAGTVMEAGDSSRFKVGDRVIGLAWTGGAFAEECVINEQALFRVPDSLPLATAAATGISYGTGELELGAVSHARGDSPA